MKKNINPECIGRLEALERLLVTRRSTTNGRSAHPRLWVEIERLTKGAGMVLDVQMYDESKGGGWSAVFDTEFAALKVFFKYRHSNVNLDETPSGWVVAVRSSKH